MEIRKKFFDPQKSFIWQLRKVSGDTMLTCFWLAYIRAMIARQGPDLLARYRLDETQSCISDILYASRLIEDIAMIYC